MTNRDPDAARDHQIEMEACRKQPEPRIYHVVAFMQNAWFYEGTSQRVIDRYHDDQEYHQRVLGMSMSGRRLLTAFGPLFHEIWWDNATREASVGDSTGRRSYDVKHMGVVIGRHPALRLVLTFGAEAAAGVAEMKKLGFTFQHLACHHPNARGKTQHDLNEFAREVVRKLVPELPA